MRPEIRLTEVPAPQRIAPYAVALTGDVLESVGADEELATGRFVVLYDPSCPSPWDGPWRIVTFARAELEPEFAVEAMLGSVGWSWLVDALAGRAAAYAAPAGTVTRVVSESFGSLEDKDATVEIEIRASWSPTAGRLGSHLGAWSDLLCTIAGLPPLPEGVIALPGPRR